MLMIGAKIICLFGVTEMRPESSQPNRIVRAIRRWHCDLRRVAHALVGGGQAFERWAHRLSHGFIT